jgi:hypothetical protein
VFDILEANRLDRFISKQYPVPKVVKYSDAKATKEERELYNEWRASNTVTRRVIKENISSVLILNLIAKVDLVEAM